MKSKTVLVTGASTGIGFEAAKALKLQGFSVYAGARRTELMAPLAELGIHVLSLDVTDEESVSGAIAQIVDAEGGIDVLVNNAGYGTFGSLEEVPLDEGRRQFEVNVFGLARITALVLPSMRKAGHGRIINVSSIGGKMYEPLGSWYHGTKFAVEGMSDALRLELKPHGIMVSIIEPAGTASEWGKIAAASLTQNSADGPYGKQANIVAAALASTSGTSMSTPAAVVAQAIVHAATANRPKTRYPVGKGAKAILFLRQVLPDRAFDSLLWMVFTRLARAKR
ncbi:oxidoreductase [Pseudarthrobacter sp. J1738]|uniref:oxidoreductase n=1 Tax=unclassified Pseudarthrobacter TaxID=2647000 RepID=UPI003D285E8D